MPSSTSAEPVKPQKNGRVPVLDQPDPGSSSPNDAARQGLKDPGNPTIWVSLRQFFGFSGPMEDGAWRIPRPDAKAKAQLLYNYCIASDRRVSESVHSLFAIAEHYATDNPSKLDKPETINGIPPFFNSLSNKEKSTFCYNQVTEALSSEAKPVTIESLLATRRLEPSDPYSSYAGRFVRRVTSYVVITLFLIGLIYAGFLLWNTWSFGPWMYTGIDDGLLKFFAWVAFGCIGALVHLLNHALTTTRLQTFEVSEERKIGPRLLLGGMLGFILPWLAEQSGIKALEQLPVGTVAAFFAGYSVRFVIGLLERVLAAFLPETETKK